MGGWSVKLGLRLISAQLGLETGTWAELGNIAQVSCVHLKEKDIHKQFHALKHLNLPDYQRPPDRQFWIHLAEAENISVAFYEHLLGPQSEKG